MRRLLVSLALVTLFILSFPALFSEESRNLTGISSIASAGRMIPNGRWCDCGTPGCICDPGEEPCTSCPNQGLVTQPSTESKPVELETGTGITLIVAAAFLVLRLRQIV